MLSPTVAAMTAMKVRRKIVVTEDRHFRSTESWQWGRWGWVMKVDSLAVVLDRMEKKPMEANKKKEKNDVAIACSPVFMFSFLPIKVLSVGNSQDFSSLQPPSLP